MNTETIIDRLAGKIALLEKDIAILVAQVEYYTGELQSLKEKYEPEEDGNKSKQKESSSGEKKY